MLTPEEIRLLKLGVFSITLMGDAMCEFVSDNGDHWILLVAEERLGRRQVAAGVQAQRIIRLFHRHHDADTFHAHGEFLRMIDAVLEVIDHDDFRLKRKGRTQFDEVVESVRAS